MKTTIKQPVKNIGIMALTLILLSGCASVSINATKTTNLTGNARLLLMPSHDVIQGGIAHPTGKGSGRKLQESVQRKLNEKSDYKVIVYKENDKFNHSTTIKKEDAIIESIKLGADYCLILTLGEFRNAAPMTFRTDFVTLDSGVLIDVKTKKEVWSLNVPFMLQKTNIGNHNVLIDDIAEAVVESIVK